MRAIRIAAITFATVFLSSAGSHADGTWCARVGDMGGAINCGFSSFEQCEAARSGNGGFKSIHVRLGRLGVRLREGNASVSARALGWRFGRSSKTRLLGSSASPPRSAPLL